MICWRPARAGVEGQSSRPCSQTTNQKKNRIRTVHLLLTLAVLLPVTYSGSPAQEQTGGKSAIYHDGWIDLNKNGRMDVYENPRAQLDARVEDLLSQMTLEEKTCQTATLYGFNRVL